MCAIDMLWLALVEDIVFVEVIRSLQASTVLKEEAVRHATVDAATERQD